MKIVQALTCFSLKASQAGRGCAGAAAIEAALSRTGRIAILEPSALGFRQVLPILGGEHISNVSVNNVQFAISVLIGSLKTLTGLCICSGMLAGRARRVHVLR
jgi:hypothetical protein